ncbi:uncharacterized protein LOC132478202 isoform X2 [Mesoplodon densirostris]|uniref:uncharacterized protein LOC132478202 isoform X2 n=1 Tax=Mesoplodon densirostris TaxID=48708 RepID=UPI0028DC6780|nr:uncharacterized protein LOC132478202 isoform X2 [Mesoplodon densirostris]
MPAGPVGVPPAVRSAPCPRPLRNRVTFCPGLNSLRSATEQGRERHLRCSWMPFHPDITQSGSKASAGRLCGAGRGTSVQEVRGQASQMPLDPRILSLHARDQLARQSSVGCRPSLLGAVLTSAQAPTLFPRQPLMAAPRDGDGPTPLPHPLPCCWSAGGQVPSGQPELRAGWRRGDKTSQVAPGA